MPRNPYHKLTASEQAVFNDRMPSCVLVFTIATLVAFPALLTALPVVGALSWAAAIGAVAVWVTSVAVIWSIPRV